MKHLLGGAAIAALIAMGAPAMAQTSNDQQSAPAATPQEHATPESGATAPGKTGTQHATRHRTSKTAQAGHKHRASQDNMAEALNQQELQRLQQGGAMPQSGTSAPTTMPPSPPPKQ